MPSKKDGSTDSVIMEKEARLRAWFTRKCDPVLKVIDGLDIGWGGVQRWVTARMPAPEGGRHLDFSCGYGTFLAELGWRFPSIPLIGLNIDYEGPHGQIRQLLAEAGVQAELVQADARKIAFADGVFSSVSCFMGLQDIKIGFGGDGERASLSEATRVLRSDGTMTLVDEYSFDKFDVLLNSLPLRVTERGERDLDTRWDREVAERAIPLYAEGWVAQARVTDPEDRKRIYDKEHARMETEMARQFRNQGYYVPFGPMRMVIARKIG
ncbi:MAG: methyltransferase domain-containing protein [candidate division Zixibacteria bacterium]|nr:methyltransferase domain-containing protein [candidate division Zixibacteria bacterium]